MSADDKSKGGAEGHKLEQYEMNAADRLYLPIFVRPIFSDVIERTGKNGFYRKFALG